MSRKEFVPLNMLASLAGISRQAVWKACQRGNWRGHALEVRVVHPLSHDLDMRAYVPVCADAAQIPITRSRISSASPQRSVESLAALVVIA